MLVTRQKIYSKPGEDVGGYYEDFERCANVLLVKVEVFTSQVLLNPVWECLCCIPWMICGCWRFFHICPGLSPSSCTGQVKSASAILLLQFLIDLCKQIRSGKGIRIWHALPLSNLPPSQSWFIFPSTWLTCIRFTCSGGPLCSASTNKEGSGLPTGVSAPCTATKHSMMLLQQPKLARTCIGLSKAQKATLLPVQPSDTERIVWFRCWGCTQGT